MESKTLPELYPAFTPDEVRQAEAILDRYLEIAWDVLEDLRTDADHIDTARSAPHNVAQRSIPS